MPKRKAARESDADASDASDAPQRGKSRPQRAKPKKAAPSVSPAPTPRKRATDTRPAKELARTPRSDGADVHWPTDLQNTAAVEGGAGTGYHYYAGPLPPSDPLAANWLERLGGLLTKEAAKNPALAAALFGSTKAANDAAAKNRVVLQAFPEGYALFQHHFTKGAGIKIAQVVSVPVIKKDKDLTHSTPAARTSKEKMRVDPYVFGHPSNQRIRSCEEFLPHLVWLYTDPTLDHANCACKYCGPYLKKLEKGLAPSKQTLVSALPVNPDSNYEKKVDLKYYQPGRAAESVVPRWRVGEIVWLRMRIADADEGADEGGSCTAKGAEWCILPHDGTAPAASASSSSSSPDDPTPLWPCRIIQRFARVDAGAPRYSYQVHPLATDGHLFPVPEAPLRPYLEHQPPAPEPEPRLSARAALTRAVAMAANLAGRARPSECYAWYHTGSVDDLTEEARAWIDKMEKLNHYKGLWLGSDFLRRGDLIRLKPEPGTPRISYLWLTSIYQELELIRNSDGAVITSAAASALPPDSFTERRTLRITGEEWALLPVALPSGGERPVWHFATRAGGTVEVEHADLAGRYRPFAEPADHRLPAMPVIRVEAEGEEEGGWCGDRERAREGERSWCDSDVLELLGLGPGRRAGRAEEEDVVEEDYGGDGWAANDGEDGDYDDLGL
ncbi:hypothetical protein DFJ74DRAFT_669570 [Hyaloraphidium curvatum]|nr:hypothetical protein DFJ74DRAFT_669570 [Hyaloraphidium curvatum]